MGLKYTDLLASGGSSSAIREELESVYMRGGIGSIESAISNSFRGINHRQQPNSIPVNKDYHGLAFFTRPRMNMTTDNLRQVRQFVPLLTTNPTSIPRAIRSLLDTDSPLHGHTSPLTDDHQAFIPILTNQLTSMSGWPDVVAQTYTSKPGAYKEAFSIVDGVTFNYETYDIQANFRNIQGDPITALLLTWVHYASLVFQGLLVPYPDMIIENRIDYQTRIYRLILDPSKRFVQKIAACGAAFPISSPIGGAFNFETDSVINRTNEQISVSFRAVGAMYQDDILIDEFNRTVIMHNSDMADQYREREFVKLTPATALLFNNLGYPRIDPNTNELEWWVRKDDYNELMSEPSSDPDSNFLS